jgi:hypothetical protein
MESCRADLAKFSHTTSEFAPLPLRPRALFHLERLPDSAGGLSFQRLRGGGAINRASDQIYRARTMAAIAGRTERLARITRVAAAIPQHFVLRRPVRFADLDAQVGMILDTIRATRMAA